MNSKLLLFTLSLTALLSSSGVQAQEKLSLEKIWMSREYSPESMPGLSSMKNGKSYSLLEPNKETKSTDIVQYSYEKGTKEKVLVDGSKLKNSKGEKISIESYELSPDEKYALIQSESENIYRHSFIARYYVLNLATSNVMNVSGEKVMHASFSPDGKKVAFLKENNLWYFNMENGAEVQVSKDGSRNQVINGSCDWVYEEEFGFTRAYEWSPNSDVIGYYRFDESGVKEFSMPMYEGLYPSEYRYKYPKAGEENSNVSIHFYHLNGSKDVSYDFGDAKDFYVPRLKWSGQNQYAIVYFMNRLQNELTLFKADVTTGKGSVLLTEKNKYYIDIHDVLHFTADGKYFIWQSEQDGYNHLYLYHSDGKLANQITKGSWDVDAVSGIDDKKKLIWFTSSEVSPMERQLYSISFEGKKKKQLSSIQGYHTISFNASKSLYIDNVSSMSSPALISLHKADGKQLRILKDNAALRKKLEPFNLSPVGFFNFTTSGGTSLNGWMIRPPDFQAGKKYPVLMFVYGGPGSQTVVNRWGGANYLWYQYLAEKGYVVVSVDNRGTGFRGEEFKKCTYLELGKKRNGRPDRSSQIPGLAQLHRQGPHRYFRLELRRLHELALHHQRSRLFQNSRSRCTGYKLEVLRQHLYRALHAQAAGEREKLRRQLSHQSCGEAERPLPDHTRDSRR
jgi:dipeptidyl-peptidase 4